MEATSTKLDRLKEEKEKWVRKQVGTALEGMAHVQTLLTNFQHVSSGAVKKNGENSRNPGRQNSLRRAFRLKMQ